MRTMCFAMCMLGAMLLCGAAMAQDAAPAQASAEPAYPTFYSSPTQVDALFDAFVDTIPYAGIHDYAAKNQTLGYYNWPEEETQSLVDFNKLLALHDRFGYMPEYWQMLYSLSPGDDWENNKYLEKAYTLFPQDPRTVYFYATECALHSAALEMDKGTRASSIKAMQMEQEAVALIVHAAELDGRNSFYWYEAGFQESIIAGFDDALPFIIKGNEMPVNSLVRLFPYNYIRQNLPLIKQKYPDKYLLIGMFKALGPMPNYIKHKGFMKNAVVAVNLSGNLDWLTQMNRYACRFGAMDGADEIQILCAVVFSSVLQEGALDVGCLPEDRLQVKAMMALANMRGRITGNIQDYERSLSAGEFAPDTKLDDPVVIACFEKQLDSYARFESDIRPLLAKVFTDMAAYDFANPALFGKERSVFNDE